MVMECAPHNAVISLYLIVYYYGTFRELICYLAFCHSFRYIMHYGTWMDIG